MSDLLLLIIFMILLLMVLRTAKQPETAEAVASLVGTLDRRHTDRQVEVERSKHPPEPQKGQP